MYRLIYKSRAAENITWEIMQQILESSERNNVDSGITGVLLASNMHFLQVIEGKFEDLNRAFAAISRDRRHHDLQLISYGIVDARLFSNWGMKGIGAFGFNSDLSSELKHKYGTEGDDIKFPLVEWQALSMIYDIQLAMDLPAWKRGI